MNDRAFSQLAAGRLSSEGPMIDHTALRPAAWLLLGGQLLYIVVTQLHAGGDANDHHGIFATYAANTIWTAVHIDHQRHTSVQRAVSANRPD